MIQYRGLIYCISKPQFPLGFSSLHVLFNDMVLFCAMEYVNKNISLKHGFRHDSYYQNLLTNKKRNVIHTRRQKFFFISSFFSLSNLSTNRKQEPSVMSVARYIVA
jgi:hypothetical protein